MNHKWLQIQKTEILSGQLSSTYEYYSASGHQSFISRSWRVLLMISNRQDSLGKSLSTRLTRQ